MAEPEPWGRRREVRPPSARSLLLTVLGEFALPRAEPVWTATVLDALALLGIDARASRQALARTAAEGLLVAERHGRRTAWSLTGRGTDLLTEGSARIYGFGRRPHDWDGRWLVLTVAVPDSDRRLSRRLRTRLTWLGLGSPSTGLWVSPDATLVDAVERVLGELGLGKDAFCWVGPGAGVGEEQRLVASAWDLDDVEARYREFLVDVADRHAGTDAEAFAAQVAMVQTWRRFPFVDPDLPRTLLDHAWPGHRAAEVFHDRHARWHRPAQRHWTLLQREASGRT